MGQFRNTGEDCTRDGNNSNVILHLRNFNLKNISLFRLADAAIQSAIAIYTRQLSLQPEVTGGGDSVFSVLEHEYTVHKNTNILNFSIR